MAVEVVVAGWAPLAAARWLGITPRRPQPHGELLVPRSLLDRRLTDATCPAPPGASPTLRAICAQPMILGAATLLPRRREPARLDATGAGLWQLRSEDAQMVLP